MNNVWSSTNGSPIKLWKYNLDGPSKLLAKVPSLIPYCPTWGNDVLRSVEKEKVINVGLSKYVEF